MNVIFLLFVIVKVDGVWRCGGSTLSYPPGGQYDNSTYCTWTVIAPKYQRVKIVFKRLKLDTYCRDELEIATKGGVIGKPCKLPESPVVTPDNVVKLTLRANAATHTGLDDMGEQRRGFKLQFVGTVEPAHVSTCGRWQLTTGDSFSIPKKGWSPTRIDCSWSVKAPPGMVVEARIRNFDIGWKNGVSNSCRDDYLKIWNLGGGIGTFCGLYIDTQDSPVNRLISSGQIMNLQLHAGGYMGALHGAFTAIDPASVYVQHFVSLTKLPVFNSAIRFDRDYVWISYQSQTVKIFPGMTAQFIHVAGTGEVNISITYESEVFIMSSPTQNWVILNDGIYRQDGSGDLASTASDMPDYTWP